jgi:hypothetical protein
MAQPAFTRFASFGPASHLNSKPSQFIVAKRATAAQANLSLPVPTIRYVASVPWSTEEQDGLSRRCPGGDARWAIGFAGTPQRAAKVRSRL